MSERIRILIVEDDDAISDVIVRILCARPNCPFICQTAKTFKHCLQICQAGQTDYVILDLGLPDSIGFEGLLQLKYQIQSDIKIIVITGSGDLLAAERAKHDFGVIAYINKPFDIVEFYQTVYQVIIKDLSEKMYSKSPVTNLAPLPEKVKKGVLIKKWLKKSAVITTILGLLAALVSFAIKAIEFLNSIFSKKG